MATLETRRLTSAIGAVVEGVDLSRSLEPEVVKEIRQALLEYGVIFFRGQDLSVEQFWAFMEEFGTPHKEESVGTDEDTAADVMTADLGPTRQSTAVWHADTTSLAVPPWGTALRAVQVPPFGGDTCWASATAAYEALSEPVKRAIDGLTAVHTIQLTLDRMPEHFAPIFMEGYGPRHAHQQVHPVVIQHPETGRKALYVSESFTTRIVELSLVESKHLLAMLLEHLQRPEFTMRWTWSPNDIAFWDNRAVQHYAVPDYESERVMQRIVLKGERPQGPASL